MPPLSHSRPKGYPFGCCLDPPQLGASDQQHSRRCIDYGSASSPSPRGRRSRSECRGASPCPRGPQQSWSACPRSSRRRWVRLAAVRAPRCASTRSGGWSCRSSPAPRRASCCRQWRGQWPAHDDLTDPAWNLGPRKRIVPRDIGLQVEYRRIIKCVNPVNLYDVALD